MNNLTPSATISTIPVITSNMDEVLEYALQKKKDYESLAITEEMTAEIKAEKAELNKQKKMISDYRIEITKEYNKPLEDFISKAKAAEKAYTDAYNACNEAINRFDQKKKDEKEKEIRSFFAENNQFDWLTYEQANINVTLSASIKGLKDQVSNFLEHIKNDVAMIQTLPNQVEVLTEYKNSLNASLAVATVNERMKREQEERERLEAYKKVQEEQKNQNEQSIPETPNIAETSQKQAKIEKPQEVTPPQEVYSMKFTVKGTLSQLKALKTYMESEGIIYE